MATSDPCTAVTAAFKEAQFAAERRLALCQRALAHYENVPGMAALLQQEAARAAERPLGGSAIVPFGDGLINETFLITLPTAAAVQQAVLQRVHAIFGRAVHEDIEAVTAHLEQRGMATPRLFRTTAGELSVDLGDGGIWRLLTFIAGVSHSVMVPKLARPAGAMVGRFHAALTDLGHKFHFVRVGAHDLRGHLQKLRNALAAAERADFVPPESPVPAEFFTLARELLEQGERMPLELDPSLPLRLCHGDLKLSNLRFDADGQGVCLLDLDTLAYLPLAFELGDALRSWCNPSGEDTGASSFDLGLFEEALSGYASTAGGFLLPVEQASLVAGVSRITFQLAVRFAADVVYQSYFRWNRERHGSRASHNLLRAQGQWSLCRSFIAARPQADAIVARLFAAGR